MDLKIKNKKKKSSIVPLIIFIFLLIGINVKYLMIKLESRAYKEKYDLINNLLTNSKYKCFYVDEALVIARENFTELLIWLPYDVIPKGYEHYVIKIKKGYYFKKVVDSAYLNSNKIKSYALIKNKEICVT